MIVACELGMSDGAHAPFNAGILATILAAFPDEAVVFLGTAAHIKHVEQQLGASAAASVSWKEIRAPGPGVPYFRRLLSDLKIIWGIRTILGRHPRGRLLFTSSYPSTLIAAKLMERFRLKGIRLQAVLHGGLSGVTGKRHRHPIRRFQEMRTAMTLFKNSEMQYLVLEEPIRKKVLTGLPSLAGKVEVLEHPLPPHEGVLAREDLGPPVRFGFLGLANQAKGFPTFTRLALEMATTYRDRAAFHAVGWLPADAPLVPDMDALATTPGRDRLSRASFIQGVTQLHFVVLPHHPGYYDMSATGTLLDAIAWKKPLVARRIPVFESMFTRYGDIGYLFDNDAELRGIVENIVQQADRSRYRAQVLNMHQAHVARMPAALAVTYRAICNRNDRVDSSRPETRIPLR